jgi:hypothetical protein
MRRASLLIYAVLALMVFVPAMAEEHDVVFDNVVGRMCFRDLLRESGWSIAGPFERAAFVVEQSDGSIKCECWPSKHTYQAETFKGPIPQHTIAIAHTHPFEYPRPSQQDKDEATRLGMPIYVITIHGVYKAIPGVKRPTMIARNQGWIRNVPNKAPSVPIAASP